MPATLSDDRQTFTLTAPGWSDTYPITDFPKWLAFYRKMAEDYGHPTYKETVAELEALELSLPTP